MAYTKSGDILWAGPNTCSTSNAGYRFLLSPATMLTCYPRGWNAAGSACRQDAGGLEKHETFASS